MIRYITSYDISIVDPHKICYFIFTKEIQSSLSTTPSFNSNNILFDPEARKERQKSLEKMRKDQAKKAEEMASARREASEAIKAEAAKKAEEELKRRQVENRRNIAEAAVSAM